jgi:hypothetical protein
MNNEQEFGKVLYEVSPRRMIDEGEIVPPKLHIIHTKDEGDYDNATMRINTVIEGYGKHRVMVKKGKGRENLGAKLLITTTGNLELFELHDDERFRSYCKEQGIKVFAYSSERGSFMGFEPKSRDESMQAMRDLGDNEDAILLHIDILTEGIDLPSITGVMPFRELNPVKLLQTIGRGARLLLCDRQRLYAGLVTPKDWNNYIKPCCWIVLPEFFRSLGNAEVMKEAIRQIVRSYEVPVEQYCIGEDGFIASPDDDLNKITLPDTRKKRDQESELTHIVEEVMIEKFMTTIPDPLMAIKKTFLRDFQC